MPMAEGMIQVDKKAVAMVAGILYVVEREETVVMVVADKRQVLDTGESLVVAMVTVGQVLMDIWVRAVGNI